MIAGTILTVIMASMIVGMQREAKNLGDLVTTTHRERAAQVVMHRVEELLDFAAGSSPSGWLSANLGSGETTLQIDTSLGFPASGTLLIDAGTASQELIDYTGLNPATHTFTGLDRGVHCTAPNGHVSGARVFWAGSASALENQLAPPPSQWDGQANTAGGPIFFRGIGTSFSFRVPTDPAGGTNYFDATGIRWGSDVNGAPSTDGWSSLQYVATRQLAENQAGVDINADGDLLDIFDLGQIRLQRWNSATNGVPVTDVALCPPIIAQEICNYGGDLDGDAFADPIFLWNAADGSLRIQMTIISGVHNTRSVVSRVESTMYLRNGAL